MSSVGEELPKKMQEIREVYIPAYQEIGPSGAFAISVMQNALTQAEKALASGDVIEILRSYEELNGFKL